MQRLLPRALLYLATGLLLTISTSWLIAAFAPLRPTSATKLAHHHEPGILAVAIFRGPGWTRRAWTTTVLDNLTYPAFQVCLDSNVDTQEVHWIHNESISWLPWGQVASARSDPSAFEGCDHATGWPLPALWYSFKTDDVPDARPHVSPSTGIEVAHSASIVNVGDDIAHTRALPLRPIYLGLALNTLFWSVFAFTLSLLASSTRRALRRRRGHCPRCNYDLIATPTCPECGWSSPDTRR